MSDLLTPPALVRKTCLLAVACLVLTAFAGQPAGAQLPQPAAEQPAVSGDGTMIDYPIAVLQTLDKVTGRISTLRVPVGDAAGFGTLTIVPRACRKRPPEESPESAGFLEIDDAPPAGQPRRVFTGWMFASSPAVSAMEHPVFDVWVRDCITAEPPKPDQPAGETPGSG
ncbi:MAG: DUF2155 domain-containing protein [Rhodospirillales bacterium]